jgi:predicted  nucleic acid-binding Zn-ribbon protein
MAKCALCGNHRDCADRYGPPKKQANRHRREGDSPWRRTSSRRQALSAEQVLEREATRFEERVERARKELADAEHELERVQVALKAMREVRPSVTAQPDAFERDAAS